MGKTQLAIDFARRHKDRFSCIFWLDGRSEDQLKQSIADCVARIPEGQIPGTIPRRVSGRAQTPSQLDDAVAAVMNWLEQPSNSRWLLIFDNVDKEWRGQGQDDATGAYDLARYLPGDHGSVLVTTRLSQLAQLGESRKLEKVDRATGKAILESWFGGDLGKCTPSARPRLHTH